MPRFVVLLHETPPGSSRATHYDLMLEQEGGLLTFALDSLPSVGGETASVQRLPDHRLAYLDYEGPLSGDRGRVSRVDQGTCERLPAAGSELAFQLAGTRLRGRLILTPPAAAGAPWQVQLLPGTLSEPSHVE